MNAPLDASESPATGGTVRRRAGPPDRAWIANALGSTSALDAQDNHIEIAEDGAEKVAAIWYAPEDHRPALLGVVMASGAERRDLFYGAILAAAEAALAAGHTHASFRVLDRRLVTRIRRDFGVTMTPSGRNVKTGQPGHWELTVDLASAAAKLRRFVPPPAGPV